MRKPITPHFLADLIDYGPGLSEPWKYCVGAQEMRSAQARGAAKIYNFLTKNKVALLADEVGMGKTIQALSVCAALWQEKPDARVLIIAPREEVARNWMTEYKTFVQLHYRTIDHVVKTSGEDPIARPMTYCQNLYALTNEIIHGHSKLMIAKTSSFSSAVARREIGEALENIGLKTNDEIREAGRNNTLLNKATCRLLKKEILKGKEGIPVFDLMIIDEAHYFRNIHGDSQRVEAAKIFFGDPNQEEKHLAHKTLLMTATPNHSSSEDIGNIVSYFTEEYKEKTYDKILKDICVRRLRRLSSKGKTKYQYRNEQALSCGFEGNPMAELFFGLYQFNLVQVIEEERRNGGAQTGHHDRLRRYLEGTEFIPVETEPEDPDSYRADDFRKGTDSSLLIKAGKQFKEIFKTQPAHPKYDKIKDLILENEFKEKKVVFVRRIPSVFEISKRVIEELDANLWGKLRALPGLEKEAKILDRKTLDARLSGKKKDEELDISEEDIDTSLDGMDERYRIPHSEVLNLFKTLKGTSYNSTVASNFRKRFEFSKPSPFAMFFSPGEKDGTFPYQQLRVHGYKTGQKVADHYYESAFTHRMNSNDLWKEIPLQWLKRDKPEKESEVLNNNVPTLITLFFELLQQDPDCKEITAAYHEFDPIEKEALSHFIAKGTLNASEDIVYLFIEFWKTGEKSSNPNVSGAALSRYLEFCERIRNLLPGSSLFEKTKESIKHFKTIYTKVFGISSKRKLMDYHWLNFNLTPIYPYNADNKNKEILDSFNTPFYPNVLVATSVLQEGVNLQYFCDKMYHYGAAWTPGDNEQRVGRIDRMFGKIERKLEEKEDAKLDVVYPFLKDTIDENNLLRLFKRKRHEEILLDEGRLPSREDSSSDEEDVRESIGDYLRTPTDKEMSEPYTAHDNDFKGLTPPRIKKREINLTPFNEAIIDALTSIPKLEVEIQELKLDEKQYGLVADPFLAGKRRQPVLIEYFFDPIGTNSMGEIIFTLSMRSPLQSSRAWIYFRDNLQAKRIYKELQETNIKVCLNHQSGGSNHWGLYLRVDIPVFVERPLAKNPLSSVEIQEAFKVLTHYSDKLEKEVFDQQDIKKEDLMLLTDDVHQSHNHQKLSDARGHQEMKGWKKDGAYLKREQFIRLIKENEAIKHIFESNHRYPYIKFFSKGENLTSTASILLFDALSEEMTLLEQYLGKAQNDFRFNLAI